MKFVYTGKIIGGKSIRGTVEASSVKAASESLRNQHIIPVAIREANQSFSLENFMPGRNGVGVGELANFTRQLSTMITAGLPLTDALNLLKMQSGPRLTKVSAAILTDVQGGIALSEAMGKFPDVFSRVYVALVKAAEAAGVMETVLNRLAETSEKSREFHSKIIGAMIYPIIIVIGMIGVTVMVVVLVIPKLSDLYKEVGSELPVMTKMLIAVSDIAVKYWWLGIILGVGGFIGFGNYFRSDAGRKFWDSIRFKLPIVGPMSQQVMLTEFTRTMALLVSAGVSVVDSLDIVSSAVGNSEVEREVKKIARQVEKGFPVSICFSESRQFPQIVGQMVAVGEETGRLDEVMEKLSRFFETEAETRIKALTTAIEPLILMVMAVGVGFLMYAVVMPLYDVINKV